MTDTLIVIAVIALLCLIAMPIYRGRADEAKLAQARREAIALGQAELAAAQRLGYFVPLHLLDDLPAGRRLRTDRTDDIANKPAETLRVIDPARPCEEQVGKQKTLAEAGLVDLWPGPFYEPKRVWMGSTARNVDPASLPAEVIQRDWPLDPWGTPYRFYSPIGLIGTAAGSTETSALAGDAFGDGVLTLDEDRFDSFSIVSFGPDRQSDVVSGNDDDVIYLMPPAGAEVD